MVGVLTMSTEEKELFTSEEWKLIKSEEGKGDCDYCYRYSGYNSFKCPRKATNVHCDVLSIVKTARRRVTYDDDSSLS